jgi:hypothetical protein
MHHYHPFEAFQWLDYSIHSIDHCLQLNIFFFHLVVAVRKDGMDVLTLQLWWPLQSLALPASSSSV